jgi:hypothetical protein
MWQCIGIHFHCSMHTLSCIGIYFHSSMHILSCIRIHFHSSMHTLSCIGIHFHCSMHTLSCIGIHFHSSMHTLSCIGIHFHSSMHTLYKLVWLAPVATLSLLQIRCMLAKWLLTWLRQLVTVVHMSMYFVNVVALVLLCQRLVNVVY